MCVLVCMFFVLIKVKILYIHVETKTCIGKRDVKTDDIKSNKWNEHVCVYDQDTGKWKPYQKQVNKKLGMPSQTDKDDGEQYR